MMRIDPADVSGLLAAFSALAAVVGATIGWLLRERKEKRAKRPIFIHRRHRIQNINRLDEPLYVTQIGGDGRFFIGGSDLDSGGSLISQQFMPTPFNPKWEVAPLSTQSFPLSPNDPSVTSIEITAESSLRTIVIRRLTVKLNTME
jgi:hypothetical protein